MLEGTQHRMFELFDAETKHQAAGTELGLYISKLLVELMVRSPLRSLIARRSIMAAEERLGSSRLL